MTKKEFINKIVTIANANNEETKINKTITKEFVEILPEAIKAAVIEDGDLSLVGFATFKKKDIPEKTGTSVLNGVKKQWTKPARSEVSVKLSSVYKQI